MVISFKKSSTAVEANRKKWQKNLTGFEESVRIHEVLPNVEHYLIDLNRIPSKSTVIGWYNASAKKEKSRHARNQLIALELQNLWKKFDFLCITLKSRSRKINAQLTK